MFTHVVHLLSSDALLACLIPLVLFLFSLQLLETTSLAALCRLVRETLHGKTRRSTPHYFSVERALQSYEQYANLSEGEITTMRSSYARLSRAHKRVGYELGYPRKLERLREAIHANAQVTNGIASLARDDFRATLAESIYPEVDVRGDLNRVREALKHFVRDWSAEGREERARIFGPILEVLREVDPQRRGSMRVLVPGSGLGRLAWEISELEFNTTANELSSFMNLAFRFLLSEKTTHTANQHTLQPYASWFSHQRTTDALFRRAAFPDIVPRLKPTLQLAECDFLSLGSPPQQDGGYDYVVTLFFLDTSLNAIETIEHIHTLLRPRGTWVNLGPLLWTGGGQAAVELSLEEVLKLLEITGFHIVGSGEQDDVRRRRTVECEYTADRLAMMRWLYQAEFWTAVRG